MEKRTSKPCIQCGEVKPITDYYGWQSGRTWARCKTCIRANRRNAPVSFGHPCALPSRPLDHRNMNPGTPLEARIALEDGNIDPDAIGVFAGGRHVGYIPAVISKTGLADALRQGARTRCEGHP